MTIGMPLLHQLPFFFFFVVFFFLSSSSLTLSTDQSSQDLAIKAAYWPSYTASYTPITSINTSLFTHLLYAFASVNAQTFQVEPDDALLISQFSPTLHSLNPSIITLLSIGGGNASTTLFSLAMATSTSRKSFINSSIVLARANGFQGLNIDWEFPRSEADMANFGDFLVEWRDAVNREVVASNSTLAPLLLTAAVYYASRVPSNMVSYPMASINENLDLVHIMSYDYHGSWENYTGEHTALSGLNTNYTTLFGLRQWIADGLNPLKAIVGLAIYGKSWNLLDASQNGVGAPALGPGPAQTTSKDPGTFLYFEIENFIVSQNATIVYDNVTSSVYCYSNQVWIGYDDPTTLAIKINAFKDLGFKGYFFWALSYDVHDGTWPLSTKASLTMDNVTPSSNPSPQPPSYNKASHYPLSSLTLTFFNILLGSLLFIPSHRV